jgi:hypothetical protein
MIGLLLKTIWHGKNTYGASMGPTAQETNRFSNTQQPKHTHTQPTKPQITHNTVTMVPPSRRLPTAQILQVSTIAVHRAIDLDLCNTAMYFLLTTLTLILYLFNY